MDEITEHWVTMWNYGIFSVIPRLFLHRPGFFIYQTTYISSLSCPYIIKQYHVFYYKSSTIFATEILSLMSQLYWVRNNIQ